MPLVPSENHYQPNPDETSHQLPQPEPTTFEVIDADTLHITDAWLNSFYNDSDCIEIRGQVQALETLCVKILALGRPKQQILGMVQKFTGQLHDVYVKC